MIKLWSGMESSLWPGLLDVSPLVPIPYVWQTSSGGFSHQRRMEALPTNLRGAVSRYLWPMCLQSHEGQSDLNSPVGDGRDLISLLMCIRLGCMCSTSWTNSLEPRADFGGTLGPQVADTGIADAMEYARKAIGSWMGKVRTISRTWTEHDRKTNG